MTEKRNHRDEPERLALDALAPGGGWLERLASLGHEAAVRRRERASWTYGLATAGRWVIPLAAAMAAVCWIASTRLSAPSPTRSALLLAGSSQEALMVMTLAGRR